VKLKWLKGEVKPKCENLEAYDTPDVLAPPPYRKFLFDTNTRIVREFFWCIKTWYNIVIVKSELSNCVVQTGGTWRRSVPNASLQSQQPSWWCGSKTSCFTLTASHVTLATRDLFVDRSWPWLMTSSTVRHIITSCWLQLSLYQPRPLYQQHHQLTTSRHLSVLTSARHTRSHGERESETANRQRQTIKLSVPILIQPIQLVNSRTILSNALTATERLTCGFLTAALGTVSHTPNNLLPSYVFFQAAESVRNPSTRTLLGELTTLPKPLICLEWVPPLHSHPLSFGRLWCLERGPRQPQPSVPQGCYDDSKSM